MPNHVRNKLQAEGLYGLPIFTLDKDNNRILDFNKIIPMPEELNIQDGSIQSESVAAYVSRVRHTTDAFSVKEISSLMDIAYKKYHIEKMNMSQEEIAFVAEKYGMNPETFINFGKQCLTNIQKYGCLTWYEWCVREWGTKWNAYDCDTVEEEETIYFNTAWSCPQPVIEALSRRYPNIIFLHTWADEDLGVNSGYAEYETGSMTGGYDDKCSHEAYSHYIDCWGETQCIYKDSFGRYKKYDCDNCPIDC